MDKPSINIEAKDVEGKALEIVFREGEALPLLPKKPSNYKTVINGPVSYISNRMGFMDPSVASLSFSIEKRIITFTEDDKSQESNIVTGSLIESKTLEMLKINSESRYGAVKLAKHLKRFRSYFVDSDVFNELHSKLSSFSAKVNSLIEQANNQRGKTKDNLEREVNADLPSCFYLSIPLFKGEKHVEIEVELCYDATSDGVDFYLESIHLLDMIDQLSEKIIRDQITDFKKIGFDCALIELH
jgi:hypothetical protein